MDLLRTFRRVLANLRDGAEPAAARIDFGSEPSPAYQERMDAVALTERYIDSLSDAVPEPLRKALHQCVAHLQQPLRDVPALAQHVQAHENALRATLHRGGTDPSPGEAEHLARLAEVRGLLERLASERHALQPEFQTQRLTVRRWQDADLSALLAVYGDADAMRWVGEGRAITHEECVRWLSVTRTNYETRGYGMFAVEERGSPEVIGFCGIVHPGGQSEPELKYAFRRSHWGRGLATEAATGLIAYGARSHGLGFMIATAAPANLASHRVLLKAGMQRAELRSNADGSHTQLFHWRAGQTVDPGP